jgi:hypothetical protein
MSLSYANNQGKTLPKGYVSIPIFTDQAILKICVLVKTSPDEVAGHLVMLHDVMGAKVFLGCIVDSADVVHEWLELWIQDSANLVNTVSAARLMLSNAMLDARWEHQCQAFDKIDRACIVKTGWESKPMPCTFLDLSERRPVHPVEATSGQAWELCTNEGLLQRKGLQGYGSFLHRYLYIPEMGDESPFVAITSNAPTNEFTRSLSDISGDPATMIPLNPQAGLIMAKKRIPIGLETFIDILGGEPWDGLKHGKSAIDLGTPLNALGKDEQTFNAHGSLFLETQGRSGRLIEAFHLKLRLLADIVSSVYSMVDHVQRPFLTISPENWRIELGGPGRGLPFLWTARAVLNHPGSAIPLTIEGSDVKCYLPLNSGGTSVYSPLISAVSTQGLASVRMRQVFQDSGGPIVVEGTFSTQERIDVARHDLVCFRLNLACGEINLYAHLEADSAMATGEWRFRTISQAIDSVMVEHLRKAEGVPIPEVVFEVIPLLSTPCDLYSLAVVALRMLLVDKTNSLPKVVDEMLSLLRQIEAECESFDSLEEGIQALFQRDPRWHEVLGPDHLTLNEMTPDEAFAIIPSELWWTVLGIILRMFPGQGPYALCKDYGDVQQGGLHQVFAETHESLEKLIRKTHVLIVPDLDCNQEINDVIQNFLV